MEYSIHWYCTKCKQEETLTFGYKPRDNTLFEKILLSHQAKSRCKIRVVETQGAWFSPREIALVSDALARPKIIIWEELVQADTAFLFEGAKVVTRRNGRWLKVQKAFLDGNF